jgi:ATP-dependent DNA ligase
MRLRRPAATSAPVLMAVFDLLFLDDLLIRRPYWQRRAPA